MIEKTCKKIKICTYKITYISAANHHSLPNLVLNQCNDNAILPKWYDMQIAQSKYSLMKKLKCEKLQSN